MSDELTDLPLIAEKLPQGPWLVVAPQPSDETFGLGGTLLLAAGAGIVADVVFLGGGDPDEDEDAAVGREQEALAAARALGVRNVYFWHAQAWQAQDLPSSIDRLAGLLASAQPGCLFFPAPGEPRPGCRAASAIAWEALRKAGFTAEPWSYEISAPGPANRLIDISQAASRKRDAMGLYAGPAALRAHAERAMGLNQARAWPLPPEASHAEAFFAWPKEDRPLDAMVLELHTRTLERAREAEDGNVSVIVRTKNRPKSLQKAIASVAAQTQGGIELVVVNDGGEDVGRLVEQYATGNIRRAVYHDLQPGRGRAAAANAGLDLATGKYLIFLDDDDWFLPEHLENLRAALESAPNLVAAYGNTTCVAWQDGAWKTLFEFNNPYDPARLVYENYLPIHSVMFRKAAIDAQCRPPLDLDIYEDWAFWLLLSQKGPFGHVDKPGAIYRTGEHSGLGVPGADRDLSRDFPAYVQWARKHWTDEQALSLVRQADSLKALKKQRAELERRLEQDIERQNQLTAERDGQIAGLSEALAGRERQIAELGTALAGRDDQIAGLTEALADGSEQLSKLGILLAERENRLAGFVQALEAMRQSTSWKVTWPLRQGRQALVWSARLLFDALRPGLWFFMRHAYHWVPLPGRHRTALQSLAYRRFPGVFAGTPSFELWRTNQIVIANKMPFPRNADAKANSPGLEAAPPEPAANSAPAKAAPPPFQVPTRATPAASIIIPVYGQIDYTLQCLRSLAALATQIAYEVIVVDDCSPDDTREALKSVSGICVLSNETNLGFIRSCNRGAKLAKGEFLVLLNNDTEVLEGWLDALIGTFADFPAAGLVGSKLLYPDGRLQEAGGLIWNDASGWNFGRLDDSRKPEYNYVRDADYCSGASIAIRRALFEQLGGFDERYIPAYYEDTDLAFAVRQAGYRVLYQPASALIHYEGITSGTDLQSGAKAYQVSNRLKFLDKWADTLATHGNPGEQPFLCRDRQARGRILVVDATTPTPDQDSGSLDAFFLHKMLIDLGYKVTFVPDNYVIIDGYTEKLQQIGVECLYMPYVPKLQPYLQVHGKAFDIVILHRAWTAHKHIKSVKRYCPQAKVIFNTVDLHYLREERQAALTGSAQTAKQARQTKKVEFDLMRACDVTAVISAAEAELLRRADPALRLAVIPYVRDIPGCKQPFSGRKDIVFIGGFEHTPNIDAVEYFVAEIWPQVSKALPGVQFLIIGSKMPDAIKAMDKHPGVVVVGFVKDLAEYFDYCKLTVVPLRFGAGIKGKIGTSAGYGVPSVATSIAVEGMGMADGEHILVADDPQAFAERVVRLYTDEPLWDTLSQASLSLVSAQYSLAAGERRLKQLLSGIGERFDEAETASGDEAAESPASSEAMALKLKY